MFPHYKATLKGDVTIWQEPDGQWHRQDLSSNATGVYGISGDAALREILDAITSGRLDELVYTRHGFSEDAAVSGEITLKLTLENLI